jgi:hypothetical protein
VLEDFFGVRSFGWNRFLAGKIAIANHLMDQTGRRFFQIAADKN